MGVMARVNPNGPIDDGGGRYVVWLVGLIVVAVVVVLGWSLRPSAAVRAENAVPDSVGK